MKEKMLEQIQKIFFNSIPFSLFFNQCIFIWPSEHQMDQRDRADLSKALPSGSTILTPRQISYRNLLEVGEQEFIKQKEVIFFTSSHIVNTAFNKNNCISEIIKITIWKLIFFFFLLRTENNSDIYSGYLSLFWGF